MTKGTQPKGVVERIKLFNKGRSPHLIQLKYQKMNEDIFSFFRGTCHLYYEDWPDGGILNQAPVTWICGDLHLENLGAYKGENGVVYFDINDFDEASLAPCTWEVGRFLTGFFAAASMVAQDPAEALVLANCFIESYAQALTRGQIRLAEEETTSGEIRERIIQVKNRKRKLFLNEYADIMTEDSLRKIRLGDDAEGLSRAKKEEIKNILKAWGVNHDQEEINFYKVLDVAYRTSGVGSMGEDRYLILVEGKGSPNQNRLLDLKEETPSSLAPYLKPAQPAWNSEAERVVAVQLRMQGVPSSIVSVVKDGGESYILREVGSMETRLDHTVLEGSLKRLEKLLRALGEVVAWSELRSSGRQGSAIADDLIAFGQEREWQTVLLEYTRSYQERLKEDYATFKTAYERGEFKSR